ncbi:polygalacturonase ADPG2 [Curcuma longa]|uniref:polygalacturonase ADPG2 n=1 Tax=Curcuma longa TaxID=136217 RepID=UPI003D9ED597
MPLQLLLLLLLYSAAAGGCGGSTVVSVIDYGAMRDGRCYDTVAIQAAIDDCAAAGGGRVRFPAGGDYLTATVRLRTGVVLDIEPGARILGGTRQRDYPADPARWYVVLAEGVRRVGITGGGEINGQGEAFVVRRDRRKNVMVSWNATGLCRGDECRPRLVGFIDSADVEVSDVTLNQTAYWCLHLVRCKNTVIRNVSIYGDFDSPNNDGIDIEDSNRTVIRNCHIDTGDDAICLKSATAPVLDLLVTDCWIRTKSSAIKLGSASWFDFSRFFFHNITIVDSHRGLGMQIRDGGNVTDVVFSDIRMSTRYYHPSWWGRAEPIYITTCPRDSTSRTGSISNVLFVNISAVSENGVFLSGSPGALLSNLRFKNVNLTYRRWTEDPGDIYDYRPGCKEMVKHSVAGIMMEYVAGVEMEHVKMRWWRSNFSGWNNPLLIRPSTVNELSFKDWSSVEIADVDSS